MEPVLSPIFRLIGRLLLPPSFFEHFPAAEFSMPESVTVSEPFSCVLELEKRCRIGYHSLSVSIDEIFKNTTHYWLDDLAFMYLALFSTPITPRLLKSETVNSQGFLIDVFQCAGTAPVLRIKIPEFFIKKFFGKSPSQSCIMNVVKEGFLQPLFLYPSLKLLLSETKDERVYKLFQDLFSHSRITEYDLIVIARAFPEKQLFFTSLLSRNSRKDIANLQKRYTSGILKRRDEIEIIYTVEEAITCFLTEKDTYLLFPALQTFARELKKFRALITQNTEFWINRLSAMRDLSRILGRLNDDDLANLISDNRFMPFITASLTKDRLTEIKKSSKAATSRVESMAVLIDYLQREWIKTMPVINNTGLLLSRISPASDYLVILEETGWELLSQATKGLPETLMKKITRDFPPGCRYLIEDIHQGIINPDKPHDESTSNKARNQAASIINRLAAAGRITIDH